MAAAPGHIFSPDDGSIFDRRDIDINRIAVPGKGTDTYLVALANAHGGQFATFDRRLSTEDGHRDLPQIPAA